MPAYHGGGYHLTMRPAAILLAFVGTPAFAQAPVITAVENAAAPNISVPTIAPQMLVTIQGLNLASAPMTASFPWPKQIGGTSVTFNGTAAALSYVSQSQINLVAPTETLASDTAAIVVTTPASASAPFTVSVAPSAIGIFTQDASGCGQLAAYNVHADGSVSLNTPQNSLDPVSDYGLTIFLTGLGAFADRIDGVPWQFNPADNLAANPGSIFNPKLVLGIPNIPNVSSLLEPLVVTYAGPAAGLSGVDQVNATFPNAPPLGIPIGPPGRAQLRNQGCNIPIYLTDNLNSASQLVSVSIHDGGGPCVNPPPVGMATVDWEKVSFSDSNGSFSSDAVIATFFEGFGIGFPSPPASSDFRYSDHLTPEPSFCSASFPKTVDVGDLALSGAAPNPLNLRATNVGGIVSYSATLPAGTIAGGTYRATGTNFKDAETIPAPITITTSLQPGTTVPSALAVKWMGGDNQSAVTVQLLIREPGAAVPSFIASQTVLGSAGVVSFPGFSCAPLNVSPTCGPGPSAQQFLYPAGDVAVIVTQQRAVGTPAANAFPPFAISGFSLGGEQTWNYVWVFRGLSNQ